MQLHRHSIPVLQIRSKSLVSYNQTEYYGSGSNALQGRPNAKAPSLFPRSLNFKDAQTYSGDISPHARKRIARAVSLLVQSSGWQKVVHPVTKKDIDRKSVV